MSNTRDSILKTIREKLAVKKNEAYRHLAVEEWKKLQTHSFRLTEENILQKFITESTKAGADVITDFMESNNAESLPSLIGDYIRQKQLPADVVIMDPILEFLKEPLARDEHITIHPDLITQPPTAQQFVSVTLGLSGIAESGTVVVTSHPSSPSRLYFLSIAHIILLSCQHIFARYDDYLYTLPDFTELPRAIHFITGPSRTADIDQTLTIGMHGPKNLSIILMP